MNDKQQKQLNVRVPRELHDQAKLESVKQGKSLAAVIADLLRSWLTTQK